MINRFMRLVVMFDLPVTTKRNKDAYTRFRRFLLQDGYDMMQYSVYSRICSNADTARKHLERIKKVAPNKGAVRAMMVTNKQYADMAIVVGERKPQEKKVTEDQLLLF